MKKRIFFTTLLLFLVFFNAAILTISTILLDEKIETQKERCLAEHFVVASSLTKDMLAIAGRQTDFNACIEDLMRPYTSLFQNNASLLLYQGERQIYPHIRDTIAAKYGMPMTEREDGQDRRVSIRGNAPSLLWVSGRLPEPYQSYSLVYRYDMSDTFRTWQKMRNLLYLCGGIFLLLLSVCLSLLLDRIFRPLRQMSIASQNIAAGNYADRLPLSGRDEIFNMALSFNHMAEEIERQLKALQEAAEQKQLFVDNFAHELRTPLTAIYGYAEYLQKAVVTKEDKFSSTAYIMSECKRLETMASQLLDLAMLRSEEISLAPVLIADLFQRTWNTIRPKASSKQVTVTFEKELDVLTGNRDLLESLLTNLLDNAVKACNVRGSICVRAYKKSGTPAISVQDNGKGMSAEELTHVREAFYRADRARSRTDGGAGLGLTLCEQIAKAHHAALQIQSAPGLGATVTVIFTTQS